MHLRFFNTCIFLCGIALLSSCDKGYEVRFTNYNLEAMDSVIVGNHSVVFANIPIKTTTEYKKIVRGTHTIKFLTKSKKISYGQMRIPGNGTGKRTIQIDAINQISVLED